MRSGFNKLDTSNAFFCFLIQILCSGSDKCRVGDRVLTYIIVGLSIFANGGRISCPSAIFNGEMGVKIHIFYNNKLFLVYNIYRIFLITEYSVNIFRSDDKETW